MAFDDFDKSRIDVARGLLWLVYESNYGDPSLKRELDRLTTIIRKIDELKNLSK